MLVLLKLLCTLTLVTTVAGQDADEATEISSTVESTNNKNPISDSLTTVPSLNIANVDETRTEIVGS